MKRLSLEELKASKNIVANLESIKGGDTDSCHKGCQDPNCPMPQPHGGHCPIN